MASNWASVCSSSSGGEKDRLRTDLKKPAWQHGVSVPAYFHQRDIWCLWMHNSFCRFQGCYFTFTMENWGAKKTNKEEAQYLMTGGNVNVDNDICLFFGKHLALATNLFIFDHFKSVGVTSWYIVQNLQDLSSPVSSCISFNPSLVCVALLKHQIRDFTHSSVIIQIHECSYLHLLINHNHIILQTSLQC